MCTVLCSTRAYPVPVGTCSVGCKRLPRTVGHGGLHNVAPEPLVLPQALWWSYIPRSMEQHEAALLRAEMRTAAALVSLGLQLADGWGKEETPSRIVKLPFRICWISKGESV